MPETQASHDEPRFHQLEQLRQPVLEAAIATTHKISSLFMAVFSGKPALGERAHQEGIAFATLGVGRATLQHRCRSATSPRDKIQHVWRCGIMPREMW